MVLAVGEDHDRPPLGVVFLVEGLQGRLDSRSQVGPAGLDLAGAEGERYALQRLHAAERFRDLLGHDERLRGRDRSG